MKMMSMIEELFFGAVEPLMSQWPKFSVFDLDLILAIGKPKLSPIANLSSQI